MVYEKVLNIYTDGSSLPAPRRGGNRDSFCHPQRTQGMRLLKNVELPGYAAATNNEMELVACVTALQHAAGHDQIHGVERVVIFTDSLYVKENVPRAIFPVAQAEVVEPRRRPLENATIWKDLVRAIKKTPKRVDFEWVKGHSKDPHNKAVDKLAKTSAKGHFCHR